MRRRAFLTFSSLMTAWAAAQEKPVDDSAVASATDKVTPRVGIVPSDFEGSEDHDGTKVAGLPEPKPVDADLTPAQLDAMVRKAIELGGSRQGGLKDIIEPEDWVVIKTDISSFPGSGTPYVPGVATDLRVVRSLLMYLAEGKLGLRFSIVEGAGAWRRSKESGLSADGWNTDWGGAFEGLSYQSLVGEMSKRYPGLIFELVDLNFDSPVPTPVPGRASASRNKEGIYYLPKTFQQCDKVISVSPLKTDPALGVSLCMGNYIGMAPGAHYGFPKSKLFELGKPEEIAVDLFSFHPAEFAILGGSWGIEGDGQSIHHNLIVAGNQAVALDTVAAMLMGFDPAELPFLELAEQNNLGTRDTDTVWVRGREIDQARRPFKKPDGKQAALGKAPTWKAAGA